LPQATTTTAAKNQRAKSEVHHRHLVVKNFEKTKQKTEGETRSESEEEEYLTTYFTSVFHGVSFS
jgi:hypothetical protein